jgi:hypothetical protein
VSRSLRGWIAVFGRGSEIMAEEFIGKGFWELRSGWGFARFLKSFVQGSLRVLKRCEVGLGRSVWWYNF